MGSLCKSVYKSCSQLLEKTFKVYYARHVLSSEFRQVISLQRVHSVLAKNIKWQEENIDVLATAITPIPNPTAKLGLEEINRNSYSRDIKKN